MLTSLFCLSFLCSRGRSPGLLLCSPFGPAILRPPFSPAPGSRAHQKIYSVRFLFFSPPICTYYFLKGLLAVLLQEFFYFPGLWAPERVQMIGLRAFVLRILTPSLLVPVEPRSVPVVEVVELLRGTVAGEEEEGIVPGVIVGYEGFSDRNSQKDEPEGEGLVPVACH